MFKYFAFALTILVTVCLNAQNAPFDIILQPIQIPELGGLQSYAFGQHEGKWLIIGGRLDGLHRRQPWATFDQAGHNTQLIVIDPTNFKKWSAPISSLPVPLQEQLKSTNMQFYQENDYLYLVGGYGYSVTLNDHTTFDNLTAVNVPATIEAIINKNNFTSYFRQIEDARFQVTGGRLDKIYDIYYLVGGQKFIGRYNPMGPDHGPGFIQEYTDQIRKFRIIDDGHTITVKHLASITDTDNLHRRDYNVTPQIMPNGNQGLTAFSGVFQKNINLPFLNCVNIDSAGYTVNNAFSQYYNHYHCAHFPIYSSTKNEMHTVFFGGIAQYFDSLGILVQNNDVPFVRTIARVTRNVDGSMAEYKLPVSMPTYLGAGSEFIPNEKLPRFENGVIKYDELVQDTTVAGYIYGGISSSAPNIFFINDGNQSTASSQIFRVLIIKNNSSSSHDLNEQSISTLHIKVYPNPNDGEFTIQYQLVKPSDVRFMLSSVNGQLLAEQVIKNQSIGEHAFSKFIEGITQGGRYLLTLQTAYESASQWIVIDY